VMVHKANEDRIPKGKLLGAVDHAGWGDGALKHKSVMWHSLEFHSDGSVTGEFSIIEGTTHAAHMNALIEAKAAIGFSTYCMARCREPSDEEREKYGLSEDQYAVIMEDVDLVAIDAVDNPSVFDAWDHGPSKEHTNEAAGEAGLIYTASKEENEQAMNTLDDLKQKFPAIHALHEQAVAAAKAAAVASVRTALEAAGLDVSKEVTPAEMQARLDAVEAAKVAAEAKAAADLAAAETAKAAIVAERDALKAKNDEAAKVAAEAARKAAITEKADELLKGNRFEAAIKAVVVKAAEVAEFTAEHVEALVNGKIAEYDAIAGEAPKGKADEGADDEDDDFAIRGETANDDEDQDAEDKGTGFIERMAAQLFPG
jgi:hypothetical protein